MSTKHFINMESQSRCRKNRNDNDDNDDNVIVIAPATATTEQNISFIEAKCQTIEKVCSYKNIQMYPYRLQMPRNLNETDLHRHAHESVNNIFKYYE